MQLVKKHDNLQRFPNAGSITTAIQLDKKLAVQVIILVDLIRAMPDINKISK